MRHQLGSVIIPLWVFIFSRERNEGSERLCALPKVTVQKQNANPGFTHPWAKATWVEQLPWPGSRWRIQGSGDAQRSQTHSLLSEGSQSRSGDRCVNQRGSVQRERCWVLSPVWVPGRQGRTVVRTVGFDPESLSSWLSLNHFLLCGLGQVTYLSVLQFPLLEHRINNGTTSKSCCELQYEKHMQNS